MGFWIAKVPISNKNFKKIIKLFNFYETLYDKIFGIAE